MTKAQIQSFLESKHSILKNTVIINRLNSNGVPIYTQGDIVDPSAIISSAATLNGINTKVVLVTLQKESSLVNGAPPGSVAYNRRLQVTLLTYLIVQ